MPELDGIEATRRVVAQRRATSHRRVIMLTTFDLNEYVYEALRAGASGFLLKDVPPEQLAAGIRVVAGGEALLAPSITRRLIEEFAEVAPAIPEAAAGLDELTARELEVFKLVARGLSNAEIAAELIVSETTVKTHVARMLMKLGLRDRVQAVVLAYEKTRHPADPARPPRGHQRPRRAAPDRQQQAPRQPGGGRRGGGRQRARATRAARALRPQRPRGGRGAGAAAPAARATGGARAGSTGPSPPQTHAPGEPVGGGVPPPPHQRRGGELIDLKHPASGWRRRTPPRRRAHA